MLRKKRRGMELTAENSEFFQHLILTVVACHGKTARLTAQNHVSDGCETGANPQVRQRRVAICNSSSIT